MISEKDVFAVLPESGFLRSYVDWASRWLGANAAFHVPAALALLSQTVPVEMRFPGPVETRANFYALLVGPSSVSQKTRSIQAARSVLEPALPNAIMMNPGSPEACVDALNERPQIILYNEFGFFLHGTTHGQLAPLRMLLTDLYDCKAGGRNLVKRKARKNPRPNLHPRLSILAGVTPGILEAFTEEVDWSDGFLGRFFTIYATSERSVRDDDFGGRGEEERRELSAVLAKYAGAEADMFAPCIQPCDGLTAGASRVWEDWRLQLKGRAENGEPAARAAIHRALGHALKVAMLLAWDLGEPRGGNPWRIDQKTMEMGISFTELHISSVEEIAEGLASDRDGKDERRMSQAFREDVPIDYGTALRQAHLSKRRGDEMIATLLEKGLIARVADPDLMAPTRYVKVRRTNVLPFPERKRDRD